MLTAGQLVTFSAPGRGTCHGRVEQVAAVASLPPIAAVDAAAIDAGYADSAHAARDILAELGADRVALIRYRAAGRDFVFAALEISGNWYDLGRQRLTIVELVN